MATSATQVGGNPFTPGGIFSPDALDTNRAGRLTDVQRRQYVGIDRAWRKEGLTFAGILAVIGALVLTSNGGPSSAWRPLVVAVCFVAAIALVLYAMPGADRMSADLRRGEVRSLEGAMEKHLVQTGTSSAGAMHYLDVANERFTVDQLEYNAAPATGWVRLYYLPKTRKVVNLERLPDPPLPPDLAKPSMDAIKTLLRDVGHTKGEEHHEAMARMEQLGSAMKQSLSEARVSNAAPPSPGARDSRPLAEAIVGSWEAGPMSVTFDSDGSARVTALGGRVQQGRWSVDSAGRLHADAFGREQVGEAWVSGDTLTISVNGEGMRLRRAAHVE